MYFRSPLPSLSLTELRMMRGFSQIHNFRNIVRNDANKKMLLHSFPVIMIGQKISRHLFSSSSSSTTTKTLDDIVITSKCASRINDLNSSSSSPQGENDQEISSRRLRLSVDSGGCSGFQYTFTMEDSSLPLDSSDSVFKRDGAMVVVDDMSMEFVRGSTVDFVQEMIRSSFAVVNNPNSEAGCGCGASFSLKMDD